MSLDIPPNDHPLFAAWQQQLAHARSNPFLFQLLLKQFQRVLKRLAYFYAQLASLPRRNRRALQRALATSLIGAAMLLALSSAPIANANAITVSGLCTLTGAINNANDTTTGQPDLNCAAGNPAGADTIYLTGGVVVGMGSLPPITSEITLEGGNFSVSGGTFYQVFSVASTGDFTINETTIQDGYASNGGGIFNDGILEINNSTLSGNRAYNYGGAIGNNGSVTITNSTLSGNGATSDGGAIHNLGTLAITNSTLSGNDAGDDGGAIENDGTLTITNSTLSGNDAANDGGAIYNDEYETATLTNSTLSGNTAVGDGGALYNYRGATLTLTNSTLSGNTAGVEGGAIYNFDGAATNLNRTLISGNTATASGDEIYNDGTVNADNFNLFGNNDAGKNNAAAFSGFTPGASDITATSDGTLPTALASILNTTLADNGSSITTPTGIVRTLALISGSPALDKAPNADCSDAVGPPDFGAGGLDQRAFPRNVDFVPPPGANDCDIGAFELQLTTAVNVANVRAIAQESKNVLKWRTLSEAQIAGFNVYRKIAHGEWHMANRQFKQAKNPGDAQGNRYAFRDKKVKQGKMYRYKIKVKYLDGHSEWTDVVRVKTK